MSTLAEIKTVNTNQGVRFSKSDVLRGTDLDEFNQEHPRDTRGRFSDKGEISSGIEDPRIARTKRRKRRLQRAMAHISTEQATTAKPATSNDLFSLRKPQERKEVQRRERQRTSGQSQKAEGKAVSIDDVSVLKDHESHKIDSSRYIPVTMEQAAQFARTGRLAVGAANSLWGGELQGMDIDAAEEWAQTEALEGDIGNVVFIQVDQAWVHDNDNSEEVLTGQMLITSTMSHDASSSERYNGLLNTTVTFHGDDEEYTEEPIEVPIMHARADHLAEVKAGHKGETADWKHAPGFLDSVGKSDEDWDASEHPRDLRSGRFSSSGEPVDPRISRAKRRKRRVQRSARRGAESAALMDLRVKDRVERERQPRTRQDIRRRERSGAPHQAARRRYEPLESPAAKVPRKQTRLQYGGEGSGGRALSVEEHKEQAAREDLEQKDFENYVAYAVYMKGLAERAVSGDPEAKRALAAGPKKLPDATPAEYAEFMGFPGAAGHLRREQAEAHVKIERGRELERMNAQIKAKRAQHGL